MFFAGKPIFSGILEEISAKMLAKYTILCYIAGIMKILFYISAMLLPVLTVFFCTSGCNAGGPQASDASAGFALARAKVASGEAQCVLVADGMIVAENTGSGVSPLLELYNSSREQMPGAILVDKIIGRAAAFIAIDGGVKYVHAQVMSEDAAKLLHSYNVGAGWDVLTPRILNRSKTGICPMEKAVAECTVPAEAVQILSAKVAEMQNKK